MTQLYIFPAARFRGILVSFPENGILAFLAHSGDLIFPEREVVSEADDFAATRHANPSRGAIGLLPPGNAIDDFLDLGVAFDYYAFPPSGNPSSGNSPVSIF